MFQFPPDTNRKLIVFSDLDGTLLDHDNYSWDAAQPALDKLKKNHIPLVLTTSKTLAEVSLLAHELHNYYPCIVENGAGVAWPIAGSQDYELETLGVSRSELLGVLQPLHRDFEFRSCVEMSTEEFVQLTGLEPENAKRAMQRNYSEPFIWKDDQERLETFVEQIEQQGLSVLKGGRFFHLMGRADKGKAMQHVAERWSDGYADSQTVALGDSHNDIAMLQLADYAVVVKSAHHSAPDFSASGVCRVTEKIGPEGWNEAVLALLDEKQIN